MDILNISFDFFSFVDYNFSHRIDHFSFGDNVKGIINPLDGEEQISLDSKFVFHDCIE